MHPWYAKAVVLMAGAAIGIIRAAHSYGRRAGPVASRRGGVTDAFALGMSVIGFILPIVWVATPIFAFADYRSHPVMLVAGSGVVAVALWLFHLTHVALGRNWSARLQILDAHELITHGIYRYVRHPMYLALILYGLGQAAVVPNAIAGVSCLVGNVLLFALRAGPEERMMRERFGRAYDAYAARTSGLIPGLW